MQNNKKKMAVGFFGIHYNESYFHFHGRHNKIDFRDSVENYKEYIIDYYTNLGYEIDFFISSYESQIQNLLLKQYPPKNFKFTKFQKHKTGSDKPRNKRVSEVMNLIHNYQKEKNFNYDLFLITRFDLKFKIPLKFNPNKVNIAYWLIGDKASDDNIYIFEQKYFTKMKLLFDETLPIISHYTKFTWDKYIGLNNLDTLHKDKFHVETNGVFRIIRNLGIQQKPKYLYVQNKNSNKFQNNHFFIADKENNPNQTKISSRMERYKQSTERVMYLAKLMSNNYQNQNISFNFVFNKHNKKMNEFIKKDNSQELDKVEDKLIKNKEISRKSEPKNYAVKNNFTSIINSKNLKNNVIEKVYESKKIESPIEINIKPEPIKATVIRRKIIKK